MMTRLVYWRGKGDVMHLNVHYQNQVFIVLSGESEQYMISVDVDS
jgi:hypothetical protein